MNADVDFGVTRAGVISGVVFRDRDRNNRQGPGEPGVAGRVVFLDANGNGRLDRNEASTKTDSQGRYQFAFVAPGTVRLRLVLSGNVATTPPGGLFTFSLGAAQLVPKDFGLR